jgi:hypothetical protein
MDRAVMDEMQTFPPQPVVLALAGTTLELTPVRLGELPRFLAAVQPLAAELSNDPDWLALLARHGDAFLNLLAVTARRERAWIDGLSLDEAVQLAAAVFEVNAGFFVGRVVPAIHATARRLAPTLQSLGTTPSCG